MRRRAAPQASPSGAAAASPRAAQRPGWVAPGHVDLGLTIRTAAADADRLHLWAGGGITWDSDAHAEVAEAAAKTAPIRATLAGRETRHHRR